MTANKSALKSLPTPENCAMSTKYIPCSPLSTSQSDLRLGIQVQTTSAPPPPPGLRARDSQEASTISHTPVDVSTLSGIEVPPALILAQLAE